MADDTYEIVDAKDITSDEFYIEWLRAVRRELLEASGRGLEPEEWTKFVRHEVNSCLDKFFPVIKSGNVGIKYTNPVKVQYESGPEYDKSKAIGVTINLVFDFEEAVNIPT
jgi:hypothetical protein